MPVRVKRIVETYNERGRKVWYYVLEGSPIQDDNGHWGPFACEDTVNEVGYNHARDLNVRYQRLLKQGL